MNRSFLGLFGDGAANGGGLGYRIEHEDRGLRAEGVFSFTPALMRDAQLMPGNRVLAHVTETTGEIRRVKRGGFKIRQRGDRRRATVNITAAALGGFLPEIEAIRVTEFKKGIIRFVHGKTTEKETSIICKKKRGKVCYEKPATVPRRLVYLTPAKAAEFLKKMIPGQRSIKRHKVDEIKAIIENGEFTPYGTGSMKFDEHGRLFDGQHRCVGVIETGIAVWVFVEYDLPFEQAWRHTDTRQGTTLRTLADLMRIYDPTTKNRGLQEATVRWVCKWENRTRLGWPGGGGAEGHGVGKTISQMFDMWVADKEVFEQAAHLTAQRKPYMLATSVISFVFYHGSKIDLDINALSDFFEALATGAGLRKGDPAHTLRERIIEMKSRQQRTGRNIQLGMLLKTLTAYFGGERLKRIYAPVPGKQFPNFPVA